MPNGVGLPDEELFAGAVGQKAGGIGAMLAKPGIKSAGLGIFGAWLLQKILQTGHETGMRGIQREGLRSQAEMVTPENLYFQAAQPAAQEEETQARTALFQQLSGGGFGTTACQGGIPNRRLNA